MTVQNGFGERVRRARIYAGYTQLQVSKALGCAVQTICMWEQPDGLGTTRPTPKLFRDFADLTSSDIAWLYEGDTRDAATADGRDQSRSAVGHVQGSDLPRSDD